MPVNVEAAPRWRAALRARGPRAGKPRRDLWELALPLLAVVLAAGAGAIVAADSEASKQVALFSAIGVLTLTPVAIRVAQGRFDPFEPIMILAAAVFVLFIVRPLWMWSTDTWQIAGFGFDARTGLTGAATIVAVGMGSMLLGYFSSFGDRVAARLPVVSDAWDTVRMRRAAIGAVLVAAVLFSFHIGTEGGLGAVTDYFTGRSAADFQRAEGPGGQRSTSSIFAFSVYVVVPIALLMIEAWRRDRSRANAVLAILATLAALTFTVPRGDRTFILAFLLPLFVIPYLHSGRRPRMLNVAVAIVVAAIAANSLAGFRRQETRQGETLPSAIAHSVTHPSESLDRFMEGADISMLNFLAAQYDATPDEIPYKHAQGTVAMLVVPVPGLLWRSKPIEPAQEVYQGLFPSLSTKARAGFAVSMFGSWYADSAWLTVVLYGFLFGIVFRALYEYWHRRPENRTAAIVFAACLPMVIMMVRTSPTLALAAFYFLIVPLLAMIWWASKGPRRLPGAAAPS